MNQNSSPNWTKNELYIFRLLTVYFLLYLIFVSQPFGSYYQVFDVYQFSGSIIANISLAFLRLINYLFLHQPMTNADYSSDTFWGYTMTISLLVISFVVAFVWSLADKKKVLSSFYISIAHVSPLLFGFHFNQLRYL